MYFMLLSVFFHNLKPLSRANGEGNNLAWCYLNNIVKEKKKNIWCLYGHCYMILTGKCFVSHFASLFFSELFFLSIFQLIILNSNNTASCYLANFYTTKVVMHGCKMTTIIQIKETIV